MRVRRVPWGTPTDKGDHEMLGFIDIDSNTAVYVQIENQVQFGIASGKLKPGDQLPSVRELSERLDVNPNTVAKAYRDLEVMGLLYTRRGMGVFVNKGIEARCRQDCRKRILGRIFEASCEAKAAGMTAQVVGDAVKATFASDAGLYGPAPREVIDAAGKKSKK